MYPRLRLIRALTMRVKPFPQTIHRTMSTFDLPDTSPVVSVKLTDDLSRDQLLTFPAFKTWLSTLKSSLDLQRQDSHPFHSMPYTLRNINIQSCDFFSGGRLGFVKFR